MQSAYLPVAMAVILAVTAAGMTAAYAQGPGVTATSVALEQTTIITIQNSGASDIHSVWIWLAEGNSFESFKTSGGWTGVRDPPNLLKFSTSVPIVSGESAKFGMVTASPAGRINWQALDASDSEIARNVTIPGEPESPVLPFDPMEGDTTEEPDLDLGILDGSTFRIIPSSPNIGSQIRIAGEGFGTQKTLTLLLGSLNLATIDTGDSGMFVHTVRIPENAVADRVEFRLTDNMGGTLQKSLRLGEQKTHMVLPESAGLTFADVVATVTAGSTIDLNGSGTPRDSIIVTLEHPDGFTIENKKIDIGSSGLWSKSFQIHANSVVGRYSAIVTDGAVTHRQSWDVEPGTIIDVSSGRQTYDPGDELIFRGTATPNMEMEVRLISPQKIALYANAIDIGSTGAVSFEIPTMTSYSKGTYALILNQGDLAEVISVGIGGKPEQLFTIWTDKMNYRVGESGVVTIRGAPESEATLTISDTAKHKTLLITPIILDTNGLYRHELDLTEYTKAVYTATVNYGRNSSDHDFSVGFMYNAGELEVFTINSVYEPSEPIIVIGTAVRNESLVDMTLVSPSGVEEHTYTAFVTERTSGSSGKAGSFSTTFFAHTDSELGVWTIVAKSGNDTAETSFEILVNIVEGLTVTLEKLDTVTGSSIQISGTGAEPSTQVEVSIVFNNEDLIEDGLLTLATGDGSFRLEWITDGELIFGKYTITVSDQTGNSAEATWIAE